MCALVPIFHKILPLLCLLTFSVLFLANNDVHDPNYLARGGFSSVDSGANLSLSQIDCRLPDLDPWDETILPFIDNKNPLENCSKAFKQITVLENGYVRLIEDQAHKGTMCVFRCLYPKDDYEFVTGPMHPIHVKPDCDVIEVNCSSPYFPDLHYHFVHSQVYRKVFPLKLVLPQRSIENNVETVNQPDVHILILDSTSTSQFLRSMPATYHILHEEMKGVMFPFLNKVGLNSMPNGYAMLLGRRIYHISRSPLNNEAIPSKSMLDLCGNYLDEEQYIGFEFQRNGYVTMVSEDWDMGIFNWPNCKGFAKPPADHYMRPFHLRVENGKFSNADHSLRQSTYQKSCRESYQYQLEYLGDFIDKYPDKPKFSWTWITDLAHDDHNGLSHADINFRKFLRRYKSRLSNAFLIVTGDHGFRGGSIRRTKTGEAEDYNPFFMLVVPEYLRRNDQLMNNLIQNAKQMTTHFDTFATLVNIAHDGGSFTQTSSFDKFSQHSYGNLDIEGESLIQPFKLDKPRNCDNQKVPFDFCNCQLNQVNRSTDLDLAVQMGNFAVSAINNVIVENNSSELCAELTLDQRKMIEVVEYEPEMGTGVYKVTFQALPGHGQFRGFVQMKTRLRNQNSNFEMISQRLFRLDKYESTAFCAKNPMVKQYCHCLNFRNGK